MSNQKFRQIILLLVMVVVAFIFLYPLIIVFVNSVKPLKEIISNPLAFPTELSFGNYKAAWNNINILHVMKNTLIITVLSVTGIIVFASTMAYWSERFPTKISDIFVKMVISSMLIPFASLMIPLVQVMRVVHLNNTLLGAVVVYWGIGLAFAFFMTRGAVKGIPVELEEAAMIDGCGRIKIFFLVVVPLLKPTVLSIAVMDIFWIWNDFIVPLIMLNNEKNSTIQLAISRMFGMYSSRWDIALPTLAMTLVPVIIVFLLLQRKIMTGVVAGAVKG